MKKIYTVIFFTVISYSAFPQIGSVGNTDPRSMGMGKTYNSTAFGVYAIGINPANLMGNSTEHVNISTLLPLPTISVATGTNFITIDDINYFFGGVNGQSRILTDADKTRFDNLFTDGGLGIVGASVNLVSASLNLNEAEAFGFSISDFAGGRINFPEAIIDIALNGNPNDKVYNFADANVKSWWVRNYSLSFAHNFEGIFSKFYAGVSLKMVQGFYYAGTDRVNTTLQTGTQNQITGNADIRVLTAFSDDFSVKYDFDSVSVKQASNVGAFPKSAGSGFGFDIGFSALINGKWKVSVSLTDIGSINWDGNAAEYSALGTIYFDDPTNKAQRDSVKDQITGKGKRIAEFSTPLPTTLRFGISQYFFGKQNDNSGSLLLAFDFNQGLNDMPGNSKKPRMSIGMEWKPLQWIPYIRSGVSIGGELGFNWAFGLGMDAGIVEFNFATSNVESLIASNYAKQVSVSIGSRWKF